MRGSGEQGALLEAAALVATRVFPAGGCRDPLALHIPPYRGHTWPTLRGAASAQKPSEHSGAGFMNPFVPPRQAAPFALLGEPAPSLSAPLCTQGPVSLSTVPGPSWKRGAERGASVVAGWIGLLSSSLMVDFRAEQACSPGPRANTQLPSLRPGLPWVPARLPLRILGFLLHLPSSWASAWSPWTSAMAVLRGPRTAPLTLRRSLGHCTHLSSGPG